MEWRGDHRHRAAGEPNWRAEHSEGMGDPRIGIGRAEHGEGMEGPPPPWPVPLYSLLLTSDSSSNREQEVLVTLLSTL